MVDVIIVGGGPVGIFAACELKLAGVDAVVLERLPSVNQWDKAHGLTGQVVRLLDHRDLFERCSGTAHPCPAPSFFFGAMTLPLHVLDAYNPMYLLPINQRDLERVLNDRAAELGVEIHRSVEMHSFTQYDDRVEVTTPNMATNTDRSMVCRYLIGADGARSLVRKQSGIGFPGVTDHSIVDRTALIAPTDQLGPGAPGKVHVAGLGEINATFHRTETGIATISLRDPQHPLVYTAEWEDQPDGSSPGAGSPMTLTEMQNSLQRVLGVRLSLTPPVAGEPSLLRRLTGRNTRVAETCRRDRVFLLGDAAHVHSAAGGPGLNLALQDAANLAWKLGAHLHGWAPTGLLDTYTTERHQLGQRVFMQTQAQTALMAPGADVAALRELFTELLGDTRNVQHVADLLAGSDVRYDMGQTDPHPATGYFVSSSAVSLADGTSARIPQLLRAAQPALLAADPTLHDIVRPWRDRVHVVRTAAAERTDAVLIRPDGYVAWAGDDPKALSRALHTWFGKPSSN